MAWGRVFKRNGAWWTDIRHQGKRRRKKIGKKDIAEKLLQKTLGDLLLDEKGLLPNAKVTVRDFAPDYLVNKKGTLRPYSYERVSSILRVHLVGNFGHLFLYDVTPDKFYTYRTKRLANGASNATCNRELSVLKNMLTTGVELKKLKASPLQGVGNLKEPKGRLKFLTEDEAKRLLAACPPQPHFLYGVILCALMTGCRRGEILGLKWDAVKLENRVMLLGETKNGERRVVPINDTLYAFLASLPHREGYVFHWHGHQVVNVTRSFQAACKRAGITGFTLHGCRHTYASWQAMKGTAVRLLMDLLGHKSMAMTQRYSHLSPESLQSAAKLVDGIVPARAALPAGAPVVPEVVG